MTLLDEIAEAETRLEGLRRQAKAAPCAEVGHRWQHLGGKSAGCCDDCRCSIPVYVCEVCGDCDYGDNDKALETLATCATERLDLLGSAIQAAIEAEKSTQGHDLEDDRLGALIDARDAAEEMVTEMVSSILGAPPQWSNLYGYAEAYAECEEVLTSHAISGEAS